MYARPWTLWGTFPMAEDEKLPEFSVRLRALREKAGLTQQQLAMQAGLSISLVFQMEQGRRTDPTLSTMKALAVVLDTDLNGLGGFKAKARGKQKKEN